MEIAKSENLSTVMMMKRVIKKCSPVLLLNIYLLNVLPKVLTNEK